ncbi:hypothetical protein [Actinopolymorpha pittospori]|uniref:ElaB/YqjD/DUF883 family membrane-anchored ribosome-binding protein n=1 Tax=Actinopolymorpha pittospori TaxID=648752 RepID=A0A927N9H0_9ACTN|nr:hypothetical protein [Actinopolymorpha pittospori]MBE1612688.1 ElaB/YqjD/DUF883 family membrane-anchored ribosome-binding protein [Actinopolymorpha pittospori]
MPRTTRKNHSEPASPLYVLAGAGDLAVEKIREFSRMASEKISSLENTDPAVVSDRMQDRIEEGADSLSVVLRSATNDIRTQAEKLSDRAQAVIQSAWMQAGDAYGDLAERGQNVVVHLRGQNGRQIKRSSSSSGRGRSTSKAAGGRSTTKSASKSARSTSKSTTRKRSATKGRSTASSSTAGTRKSTGTRGSAAKSTSTNNSSRANAGTAPSTSPSMASSTTSTSTNS